MPIKYILTLPLLLLWNTAAMADELPDLGERSETIVSPKMDKQMGKDFMKEVRLSTNISNDMIINNYVQKLGNKLVSSTNTRKKNFHFFVVEDSSFNAFAGPDAHVGVHSGTIIAANSESELASVLAHEIAHVTQHHIERLIETAKQTQIAATAGMIAAMIIGSTVGGKTSVNPNTGRTGSSQAGDLASGLAIASLGGAAQHMINFTREHEIEADNIGMKILYKSSFDPKAMASIFERMQRSQYDYAKDIPSFLLAHPVTTDRIAEAKNRAYQLQQKNIAPQETFNLIRARTLVLTTNNRQALLKYPENSPAARYAKALELHKNLQLPEATKIVDGLQKDYPNEVLYQMLAAQLKTANKQDDEALSVLKTSLISHEDYYPLIILYAQTLIATKHAQEACDFLRRKTRKYQDDPNIYRLLARACAQNHQLAEAYQAKAKAYALEDYNHQAIFLLQQALKTPSLKTNDRIIINARIAQLKEVEKNS